MSIKFHNKTIYWENILSFSFKTEYQKKCVCCEITNALLMKYQCWRPGPIIATAIVTHWLTHTTCGDLIGITPQMTLYGQICVMAITQFKLQCFDLSTVQNFTLCVHLSFIVEGETRQCNAEFRENIEVPRRLYSWQWKVYNDDQSWYLSQGWAGMTFTFIGTGIDNFFCNLHVNLCNLI